MAIVILLVWIVCAVLCATVASSKGHSGCVWSLLGLVFGFFALIVIAVMPSVRRDPIMVQVSGSSLQTAPRTEPTPQPSLPAARKEKACPDCAEMILADARVCRHCGYRFDGSGSVRALEMPRTPPSYETDHLAATVLKALAGAAGPVTRSQTRVMVDYVAAREGVRVNEGSFEIDMRQWINSLQYDVPNLRSALTAVAQFHNVERDALLDAMELLVRATKEGDIDRQSRFRQQIESVVGSVT